jgi:hypothetical protein
MSRRFVFELFEKAINHPEYRNMMPSYKGKSLIEHADHKFLFQQVDNTRLAKFLHLWLQTINPNSFVHKQFFILLREEIIAAIHILCS